MNGCEITSGKKIRQAQKGFSIIEVLMSTAIFSLISLVVLSVLIVTQVVWNDSIINVKMQDEAKKPIQAMIKELKEADPSSPIGITISADQRTITFAVPQTISATAITAWTQISYSFDAATGQVTRTSNSQSSVIGRQISALTFSRSGSMITVNLTATGTTVQGRTLSTTLTSEAKMRK